MTNAKQAKQSYEQLKADLDTVLSQLQREDLDVDVALQAYKKGLELVEQLEKHLKNAENRVVELKAKPNSKA